MGIPQFISSSYRAYAVDFDEDGLTDIWQNPTDAIGSVANYFKQHGWREGDEIITSAVVPDRDFSALLTTGLEPVLTMADLFGRRNNFTDSDRCFGKSQTTTA